MFETWTLAVLRLRNNSSAISWFERPVASEADDLGLAGGQPECGRGVVNR